MSIQFQKRYTCEGKGGEYLILVISKGAGLEKHKTFVTYKSINDNGVYTRTLEDFNNRMICIDK